jgi:hypothetical protein
MAPLETQGIYATGRTSTCRRGRRILLLILVTLSFVMKGTPLKNRLYRVMGGILAGM